MKRTHVVTTAIAALVTVIAAWHATDPRPLLLSSLTPADAALPQLSRAHLAHLSAEEETLLAAFVVRVGLRQSGIPHAMTVGQAIDAQRDYNRQDTARIGR